MLLFLDTETTGKPRSYKAPLTDLDNWPRLVQIGWMICDGRGREKDSQEHIIFPDGYKIPAEVTRIHGITTARAKREGRPLKEVLAEFSIALKTCRTLVAHNVQFDENILGAEFLRLNMENPIKNIRRVCTMKSSTEHCKLPGPYGYKWPSLLELYYALFDKMVLGGHTALADVRACAKCYFELKRLGVVR